MLMSKEITRQWFCQMNSQIQIKHASSGAVLRVLIFLFFLPIFVYNSINYLKTFINIVVFSYFILKLTAYRHKQWLNLMKVVVLFRSLDRTVGGAWRELAIPHADWSISFCIVIGPRFFISPAHISAINHRIFLKIL